MVATVVLEATAERRKSSNLFSRIAFGQVLACSSVVELETVNFAVAGSNPATPVGAFAPSSRSAWSGNVRA